MKSLGLCVGASNIGYVLLEKKKEQVHILRSKSISHEGNPVQILRDILDKQIDHLDRIAVTGRKSRSILQLSTISEPEAVEYAYNFQREEYGDIDMIVSAGGETFMVYEMDSHGTIINVHTGNKCASGTGEFFLQQINRMGLGLEEVLDQGASDQVYKVSGRCSVFCKSDCTHALNKGTPKGDIVAGLCEMMGQKIWELLKKGKHEHVLFVGGTAQNKRMVDYIRGKGLHIIVPNYFYCYEALGTALWALDNETRPMNTMNEIFKKKNMSFPVLPRLQDFASQVEFKEGTSGKAKMNDNCILGLDVGSTTTKAVVIRKKDSALLGNCYLRTNGDPIAAARKCYQVLEKQLGEKIHIQGLGVTGSGRQIAGLHALTPAVMNEIIAHATAATFFDPKVDTIFEIGGQDAKYTYVTNGVPSDYAMNEACSAGTGSFLEEAAKESLDIDTTEIEKKALQGMSPPNFSDQCAAFISSDIKSAIQEGISLEDIAGGLVYSICMNYINRVKGNRPIGKKIFMQGGVCYNKAVPIAMASLTGKEIVVPPNPGLMGAFGAALEVKAKLEMGLLDPLGFDLKELSARTVSYQKPFICSGGKEKCDRKCQIKRIEINRKVYPFGGACDKYSQSYLKKEKVDTESLDLVAFREKLIYKEYSTAWAKRIVPSNQKKVGISRALLSNTLYPLYYNFFYALGYEIITPDEMGIEGTERKGAAFCYPVELAHGAIGNLINKKIDLLFLPHIKSIPVKNTSDPCVTCPFVQGEPYYLRSAFREINEVTLLNPVLDFGKSYETQEDTFIEMGIQLGYGVNESRQAFELALKAQNEFHQECQAMGKMVLRQLKDKKEQIGIVLFGRPYNALSKDAHMGIPHKFASRNYQVIPYDFLPYEDEENIENMYWAMGEMIVKTARFVKRHPQLFGTYITNFSCGPDSFVVGYFREIMGHKPSLTLELDSHTADAGIDTRIEAFLDIVNRYRTLEIDKRYQRINDFRPARTTMDHNSLYVMDSYGESYPLSHPKVHVLIPSMGNMGSRLLAATFRYAGIRATALKEPGEKELKTGRSYASCKECLPLILTIGSLMEFLKERDEEEVLVYFMPDTSGPCRFGQYNVLMKQVIEKNEVKNVALFSLTSENSYAGLGTQFVLRAWQSVIISDVLEEIYSAVLVLSENKEEGIREYNKVCDQIVHSIEQESWKEVRTTLQKSTQELKRIPLAKSMEEVPQIGLVGEIYVRREPFSRQYLVRRLGEKGIIVKTAPIAEWIYYCDYMIKNRLGIKATFKDRIRSHMQSFFKNQYERMIKEIFSCSGLYEFHMVDVEKIVHNVTDLISPRLTGESILTIGSAITEIVEEVDGIISIGPFGCMPSRMSEAIISQNINEKKIQIADKPDLVQRITERYPSLPFLSIEADGNVFPQVIEARLETFCLQVDRIHKEIDKNKVINSRDLIKNKAE